MYDWTTWLDHVTNPSNQFNVVDNGNGTWTITPAGAVMQQGTPQDQIRFNNIEDGIVNAHLATGLLLNMARQNSWIIERGTTVLSNSEIFPFNNSVKTISLEKEFGGKDYIILTEIETAQGNVGEIIVSDKLTNGFKIAHSGSAKSVTVKYIVLGGYLK
ncbi:MAG: hypothetical protein AB7V48_04210 [Sedimentibacter sp.]